MYAASPTRPLSGPPYAGALRPSVRGDSTAWSPAAFLSGTLALTVPLILGIYWPLYATLPPLAVAMLRPCMLGTSLLLAFLWARPVITRAEMALAGRLGLMCGVFLIPSLTATNVPRALTEWVKLVVVCFIALFLSRALRHRNTARVFGVSLLLASLLIAALIVITYVRHMGFTIPTWAAARVFKGVAEKAQVPLNTIAFACLLAYISAMCLIRGAWYLWVVGGVLFTLCSVLTGSRAPIAGLVLSGLGLFLAYLLQGRRLWRRVGGWILVLGVIAACVLLLAHFNFKQMSNLTEGRWDLWSVAYHKLTERPLTGYGYLSWRDDLVSRLPGEYDATAYIAKNIAGGYHNEYMTLLAEQGLVGFAAGMALCWFLLKSSWRLAFAQWNTRVQGKWVLFGTIFLLLRAGVEVPGLFGYAQEPADFLAFAFLAVVVSRLSREEDYLRENAKHLGQRPWGELARRSIAMQCPVAEQAGI